MMPQAWTKIELPGLKKFKSGKVREVYDLGDRYLFVASDRISAFDCILPNGIPQKGQVLNLMSAWWFRRLGHVVRNHVLSTDIDEFPESRQVHRAMLQGRSMLVRKAELLPVECIVRGYLIGSGWKEYQVSGTIGGTALRSGYRMAERLDEPIFTPSSKAESGHDENISFEQTAEVVGYPRAEKLRAVSLALYRAAAAAAAERGILIADTKFEFGTIDGELILIDEVLTPDSSRFWPAASYVAGRNPPSFDKQYVRDYLETLAWDKRPPAPALPDEVVAKTHEKYLEAFRLLTGHELDEVVLRGW